MRNASRFPTLGILILVVLLAGGCEEETDTTGWVLLALESSSENAAEPTRAPSFGAAILFWEADIDAPGTRNSTVNRNSHALFSMVEIQDEALSGHRFLVINDDTQVGSATLLRVKVPDPEAARGVTVRLEQLCDDRNRSLPVDQYRVRVLMLSG